MELKKNSPVRAAATWIAALATLICFYDASIVKAAIGLVALFIVVTFPLILTHYAVAYIKQRRSSKD